VPVLKDISFTIETGVFTAVMGRSGSGKTTLLRQLGLLDEPEKGTIKLDGVDTTTLSDDQKTFFRLHNLGFIFQDYFLLPELTALENVSLPLMANSDYCDDDYEAVARENLEIVGLGHRLDSYPMEMSGGEQQRVAVARAVAHKPKILFADEPCANLDSESSYKVLNLLKRLNREMGQTILMISHEDEDKEWVDQVIYLKDGCLDKIEKNNHSKQYVPLERDG